MKEVLEDIALFDMDQTIADYQKAMDEGLEKLRSPNESVFKGYVNDDAPKYIRERADLIRQSVEWWENLPKFQLGWDILELAKKMDFRIMILTQGPRSNPNAWAGKIKWLRKYLGNVDVTITRDKGLVYGKMFVDDHPKYLERWLKWRKRGLVIMPATNDNENYSHEQVIRYDGTNLKEVAEAMKAIKGRK